VPSSRPVMARVLAVPTVLILLTTACGGSDEVNTLETTSASSEPPTTEATATTTDAVGPVALHLTFNGESCTYDGTTELTPGPVELMFLNESEGSAAVNLVSIGEGHSIQDLVDDLGPEPSTGHHPAWTRELGTWSPTVPGETHRWEGDLEAGRYAMVCARLSPLGVWFGTGLTVEG
jgi:hypothetical protein